MSAAAVRRRSVHCANDPGTQLNPISDDEDMNVRLDNIIASIDTQLAAAAIISILAWFCEFFIVTSNSQPTCKTAIAVSATKYTIWRISYPVYTALFQAIYTLCTIFIWINLVRLYTYMTKAKARRFTKKKNASTFSLFWRSRAIFAFILEFALCTLQPFPFVNIGQATISDDDRLVTPTAANPVPVDDTTVLKEAQVSLGILIFFRLYLIARFLRDRTDIYKKRRLIHKLGLYRIHDIRFDWQLALRVLYANHAAVSTMLFFAFVVLMYALCFYAAEWDNCYHINTAGCPNDVFESFDVRKAFYLTFITICTVGYGDITPTTLLGRMCSACCGCTGLFASALIVTSFFRWLELNDTEKCVKAWCDAQNHRQNQEHTAAVIIQKFWVSLAHRKSKLTTRQISDSDELDEEDIVAIEIRHFYKVMRFYQLHKEISLKEYEDLRAEQEQSKIDALALKEKQKSKSEKKAPPAIEPPKEVKVELSNGSMSDRLNVLSVAISEFEKQSSHRDSIFEKKIDTILSQLNSSKSQNFIENLSRKVAASIHTRQKSGGRTRRPKSPSHAPLPTPAVPELIKITPTPPSPPPPPPPPPPELKVEDVAVVYSPITPLPPPSSSDPPPPPLSLPPAAEPVEEEDWV